jgi:hypothetical protein
MEQQNFACNHRINLTWDVYAGVMKAWAKDSRKHALQQAERLAATRWKELEKLDDPNFTPHLGIDTALVPPCSFPECAHHKSTIRSNPDKIRMYTSIPFPASIPASQFLYAVLIYFSLRLCPQKRCACTTYSLRRTRLLKKRYNMFTLEATNVLITMPLISVIPLKVHIGDCTTRNECAVQSANLYVSQELYSA